MKLVLYPSDVEAITRSWGGKTAARVAELTTEDLQGVAARVVARCWEGEGPSLLDLIEDELGRTTRWMLQLEENATFNDWKEWQDFLRGKHETS